MAVEINSSAAETQRISFGTVSQVANLQQKTIMAWVKRGVINTNGRYLLGNLPAVYFTDEFYGLVLYSTGTSAKLSWFTGWGTSYGQWLGVTDIPNEKTLLTITYDGSSAANDPLFYINGSPESLTERFAPSGVRQSGTNTTLFLGEADQNNSMTPIIYNLLIYNRILSQSEITDAYNSKLFIPTYRGLVFAPMLAGAAGGVGDGSTLATANTIACQVSGALGVPSGSPVLRSDTILTFGG